MTDESLTGGIKGGITQSHPTEVLKVMFSNPINIGAAVGVGGCSAAISYGIDRFLADGIYIASPLGGKIEIMKKMGLNRGEEVTRSLIAGVAGSAITLGITTPILYYIAKKALIPAVIGGALNILGWAIVGCIKYSIWKKPAEETKATTDFWKMAIPGGSIPSMIENRPRWLFKGTKRVGYQIGNRIVFPEIFPKERPESTKEIDVIQYYSGADAGDIDVIDEGRGTR